MTSQSGKLLCPPPYWLRLFDKLFSYWTVNIPNRLSIAYDFLGIIHGEITFVKKFKNDGPLCGVTEFKISISNQLAVFFPYNKVRLDS